MSGQISNDAAAASNGSSNNQLDSLRRANFDGKIPIKLVLAQTSLSSAVPPQPQHILLSRQTFLHVGLESAVRKLHQFAPSMMIGNSSNVVVQQDDDSDDEPTKAKATNSSKLESTIPKTENGSDNGGESHADDEGSLPQASDENDKEPTLSYPLCWFQDVATGQPLKWQYFAGVLFDSLHTTSSPQEQQQNHHLPWEICLHFRSYPSQTLLEVADGDVLETLRRAFSNSLKQAFVIRYGNSKEALNLSKQSHNAIWEGIATSDYPSVASVVHRDDEFDNESSTIAASIAPETTATKADTAQNDETLPEATKQDAGNDTATTSSDPKEEVKQQPNTESSSLSKTNNLVMVPVRLSVDPTKPMIQKRCEGGASASAASLGSLLLEWAPSHFERLVESASKTTTSNDTASNTIASTKETIRSRGVSWRVAGLSPPLSTPLLDLWLALRHPDNFLYISLSIPKQ